MHFSSRFRVKLALPLLVLSLLSFAFSNGAVVAHAANLTHPLSLKTAVSQASDASFDLYLGQSFIYQFWYPTCDASCGNETWYAHNTPPNTSYTFNPPVTTGSNPTTWTLMTLQYTPLGTYTITIGATSDTGANLGTLDLTIRVISPILTLPFPKATNMNIQQGWYYSPNFGGGLHQGIDYIDGTIDQGSTWANFAVLAVADGDACADTDGDSGGCVTGPGNRILIKHNLGNGVILYTYYGHLNWIPSWIPVGDRNKTVHVTQGEEIGTSGETGTAPQCNHPCVHLHFSLADPSFGWRDPYDLNTTREHYPDPNGTNGLQSGADNYWTANPPIYAPGFGTNLGGVDLVGYCKSRGNQGASLDGTTVYTWHCVTKKGKHVGISVTAACKWQYKRSSANSLFNNYYDPYSWQCYA